MFCSSKKVGTSKCFGFEQWLPLSIGNSFSCGLRGGEGHRFVTSFWKWGHIFDDMWQARVGDQFYAKIVWRYLWTTISHAKLRLCLKTIHNTGYKIFIVFFTIKLLHILRIYGLFYTYFSYWLDSWYVCLLSIFATDDCIYIYIYTHTHTQHFYSQYHACVFCSVIQLSYKDMDIQIYNFACCFVWVWNIVAHIEGGT